MKYSGGGTSVTMKKLLACGNSVGMAVRVYIPQGGSLIQCDQRDPLAVALFAIGNRSAKTLGNLIGHSVAVVAKKVFFDTPPGIPIVHSEERVRRLVLRGENQRHVKLAASLGRDVDL